MPVDRAPGHARGGGDLGQRRPRRAVQAKNSLRGIEQLPARDGGVLFGAACHKPNYSMVFTNIRDCM